MRIAALLAALLLSFSPTILAATEKAILNEAGIDAPALQKLTSTRTQTEYGFSMAGIEWESLAAAGARYQRIAALSSDADRFGSTAEEGLPELPVLAHLTAIPDEAGVHVEILSAQFELLEDYDISPVQAPAPEGSDRIPSFVRNDAFYERDEFYPPEPVFLGEPIICRDLRMIQTTICPVQYNPARRQLRVYTHIDYRLVYDGVDARNVKIRRNNFISETFLPIYRALAANADEMLADYEPVRGGYMIISPVSFADTLAALARWKHLKGYNARIIRATDIDPDGSLSQTQVFNYIQNAYQSWEIPPEFICIAGDQDLQIPDFPFGSYASDHEYSCVDGTDYLSDVMVTRMSVAAVSDLRVAMYKALKYETDPLMSDPAYWLRGLSVAGNVLAVTPRLTTLWVRQQLLGHGFTQVDTSFRWNSGEVDPLLPGYFNNGVSIISYRGWAGPSGWYSPSFNTGNLDALQYNNKLGIMASLVCGTGDFGSDLCFGEKWIRMGILPSQLKGGPCFYGVTDPSTHTKWNNPIMIGYYWALLEEGVRNFASAAFLGKMELYNTYPQHRSPGSYVEQYFHTYNTLGDPELEVRAAIPQNMAVNHPLTMPVGTSLMTVHVDGAGGAPLGGAYVNLVKGYGANEEVFVGGRTDADGDITLDFATTIADTMFVTVSAVDYIPYRGISLVQAQSVALNVSATIIDDDNSGNSSGNGDGNVNPSETIEFGVTLRNFGNSVTATNVSATLVSNDPRVNITIPTRSYPDIAPGGTGTSSPFAAHFAADIPNTVHIILRLDIACNQGNWTAALPVDIKSMAFTVTGLSYPGDPNNRLDPGESSQMVVRLRNDGELAGTAVVGHLSTSDTSVVVTDSLGDFGDIAIGAVDSNSASPFSIQVRPGVYNGRNVNFTLDMASSYGSVARRSFSAVVGAVNTYDPLGPDGYGYYLYDNTDLDYLPAPIYSWTEISPFAGGSGTRITFPFSTDDDAVVVSPPFNIVYYGQSFNYMLVSINGFVAFDTTRYDMQGHHWNNFDNGQIPEPGAPAGLIGPFWDDLEYSGNNGVFRYFDTANHRFIIEWKNCNHPNSPGQHPETFQLIFYDPAFYPTPTGDCEIVFQYETVYNDDYDGWDPDAPGMYSTVGMQSLDNADGLQYTYDNLYHPAAAALTAGRAIKITTAVGLTPPPDLSYSPSSFFKSVPSGQIVRDTLLISNAGPGTLQFTLHGSTIEEALSGHQNIPEVITSEESVEKSPSQIEVLGGSNSDDPPFILRRGGPDAFGYTWIDSDEPGGPPVTWIDISLEGIPVTLADDNYVGPFDIGFNFPFYENLYSQLYIGSNGYISFGAGYNSNQNVALPNANTPNNFLPVFWDDVNPAVGGVVRYFRDIANQRFILSYDDVPFYSLGGSLDFQIAIYITGKIEYNYGTLNPGSGSLATCGVGIENAAGNDGLTIVNNAAYLHSGLSIRIFPWLYTNVTSGLVPSGGTLFAVVSFDATGLSAGVYSGHLDLDSNDPLESSVNIPLTLTVGGQGAPDIDFTPSTLLDSLAEGETSVANLRIYNRGTSNLRVNLTAVEFNLASAIGVATPLEDDSATGAGNAEEGPADILNTWLFVSPAADTIPPGDSANATVSFDARFIGAGIYSGEIRMASNDPDSPDLAAPATLAVYGVGPNCSYIPGDINNSGQANGIDVTYGVSYFKGGNPPPYSCDCPPYGVLYVACDVNGSCTANGIDITYFVGFLKGGPALLSCPSCPPSLQAPMTDPGRGHRSGMID